MTTKALIILTYNEINGSEAVFADIPFDLFNEVLVVDGGSTDGTIEFWRKKGFKVVVQDIKGRGAGFVLGSSLTTSDIMLFYSPDGNEDASDIPKIINKLEEGYDIVVATRFGKGGSSEDAGFIRALGNKIFTLMIRLFFKVPTTDAVNGFRGIYREKYDTLKLPNSKFEVEFQMTVRSGKLRFKYAEIPTHEADRIGGYSKAGTIAVGWAFVKLFFKELFIGKRFLDREFDNSLGKYKIQD